MTGLIINRINAFTNGNNTKITIELRTKNMSKFVIVLERGNTADSWQVPRDLSIKFSEGTDKIITITSDTFTYRAIIPDSAYATLNTIMKSINENNFTAVRSFVDDQVGTSITDIQYMDNKLKLITSPDYGFSMHLEKNRLHSISEEYTPGKYSWIHGDNDTIQLRKNRDDIPIVFITKKVDANTIIMYEDEITEPLTAALIAILTTRAITGGRRRRHRKTRHRQQKKKRTHKARK